LILRRAISTPSKHGQPTARIDGEDFSQKLCGGARADGLVDQQVVCLSPLLDSPRGKPKVDQVDPRPSRDPIDQLHEKCGEPAEQEQKWHKEKTYWGNDKHA